MKLTLNSVLLFSVIVFIISILYLVISLSGFIDLGYQKSNGNPILFFISSTLALLSLFLIIALLLIKILRKIKK